MERGDPHSEGYYAHEDGEPLDANPWSPYSANGQEWAIGWLDAEQETDFRR